MVLIRLDRPLFEVIFIIRVNGIRFEQVEQAIAPDFLQIISLSVFHFWKIDDYRP